ncbi:MAG TPA: DUF167 domain-containing protein [Chloroflexota bacterium]|nr:DUF167 domain-containing protein [Chloroflexota bacterium]
MLRIHVAAHPGSRRERVDWLGDDVLGVWVQARPVGGQANRAIELAIASALGLRPRQVRLVVGEISRRKIVEIDAPSLEALRARLQAAAVQSDTASDSDSD